MINKIRKILISLLLIVVCFIIQNSIALFSNKLFVTPNILIILVCFYGYIKGQNAGMLVGFLSGLLVDIFASDVLGLNALIYLYIGFFSGIFNRLYDEDMVLLPVGIVLIGDLLYNFTYYIIRFLLRNKLDFMYYFMKIILPEMIITTVVAIVVFKLLTYIFSKWIVEEQRSTLNFD